MRYPPDLLEEIRARLPVSAVVGRRVRLKKAGREWKGLSPFNAEKSPSFFVNDQKQFYHCFSSGKHGDIFTFLMETEGLSFPEAVERLAGEAGVALPTVSREDRAQEAKRRSLHDVMELAAQFFEGQLEGRSGAKARDYLARRGLEHDVLARFRIGYAPPDRYALRDHLASKDVSSEAMIETGLLTSGEDIAVPFDRFRDRVMFPIWDPRGRVVAFGGRALAADVPAKYLNSPDTTLFSKGRLLYNFHNARKAAHDRGTVIAVEGYVDVISLSAAGFPHAVAPLGTALTEDQLQLLWRLADEPTLCFDGDKAGRRAAYRALDVALPALTPGKTLRFALLPEGQDPDDLARSGGPAAVERVLASSIPLIDLLWAREAEFGPLETPDHRAALELRLKDAAGLIKDETLRRYYLAEIRSRLWQGRPSARVNAQGQRPDRPRGPVRKAGPLLPRDYRASASLSRNPLFGARRDAELGDDHDSTSPREAMIVAAAMAHPAWLSDHVETLAGIEIEGRDARALCNLVLDVAAAGDSLDPTVIASRMDRAGLREAFERLVARIRPGDRWILDPNADSLRLDDALRQAIILHRKARALHSELRAAERAMAEDGSETNFAWLCEVQGQLTSLDGAEADPGDGPVRREADGGR